MRVMSSTSRTFSFTVLVRFRLMCSLLISRQSYATIAGFLRPLTSIYLLNNYQITYDDPFNSATS